MNFLRIFFIALLFSHSYAEVTLKVGVTPVPAGEIMEFTKPLLKKRGINLVIQSFNDYITPDIALNEGSSDANMYQHKPFLDKMNEDRGFKLVPIAPIYVVPLGLYGGKLKTLDELKAKKSPLIALPNDPSNYSRSLILLHENGLITLKDPNNLNCTEFDIITNPYKIKFRQVEAAMLPKILDGVDASIINANYALQAGFTLSQSLFHESNKSAYTNVLAARADNSSNEAIHILKEVLKSQEVSNFILEKYKGQIIPHQE